MFDARKEPKHLGSRALYRKKIQVTRGSMVFLSNCSCGYCKCLYPRYRLFIRTGKGIFLNASSEVVKR